MKKHTIKIFMLGILILILTFLKYINSSKFLRTLDNIGFTSRLQPKGFSVPTHLILGSNSIEHGINLIEELSPDILLVYGWNAARLDRLIWELEPRNFNIQFQSISNEPTIEDILKIITSIKDNKIRSVIAVGCGKIMDATKLALSLYKSKNEYILNGKDSKIKDLNLQSLISDCSSIPNDIFLCTIPLLPCAGAELSSISSFYQSSQNQNTPSFKNIKYLKTKSPDLCIVHPETIYRSTLTELNTRIIGLIATCVELVLVDNTSYIVELLAWDSLRDLMRIFDLSVETTNNRNQDILLNTTKYTEFTMNDVSHEHLDSQYFRRYGHNFNMEIIEEICRINVVVSTAKTSVGVTVLHYLSNIITHLCGEKHPTINFSFVLAHILPVYGVALSKWAIDESNDNDPIKANLRVKLYKLQEVFSTSTYLAVNDNNQDVIPTQFDRLFELIPRLTKSGLDTNTNGVHKEIDMNHNDVYNYRLRETDLYDIKMDIAKVCDLNYLEMNMNVQNLKYIFSTMEKILEELL